MSEEKFKITTVIGGRENTFVWEPSVPCRLDPAQQWVLENIESGGGVRARYLGAKNHDVVPNSSILIDEQTILRRHFTRLPGTGSRELKIKVQRLKPFNPVYLAKPEGIGKDYQLIAFNGVGKALVRSQPIHSAYVAYVRKNPVFTIYLQNEGEASIKPLLNGVRLKLKGQRSIPGVIGESWKLSREQILTATILRGSRWWRFNAFETSAYLNDVVDSSSWEDRQNHNLLKGMGAFGALFLLFSLAVWSWPHQQKVVSPPEEAPIVQFIAPKKKMVLQSPKEKAPEKPPVAAVTVNTPKVIPPKPAMSVSEKKVPEKAPKKIEKQLQAPKAVVLAPPPAPKLDPNKLAAEAAAKRVASLRDLLGGATSITKTPVTTSPTGIRSSSVFGKDGVPMAATEIKAGYVAAKGGVGAVGGSTGGGGVGYSSGERAAVGNGKASFVPVESGGVSVEEGLTQAEVGAVIYSHQAEVRYCHDTAVLYTPRLEGKLAVKFSINGQGKVVKAAIESSDLPEHMLEKCIMKKLLTWKFPNPKGGVEVSVSYPFIFKTLGRE